MRATNLTAATIALIASATAAGAQGRHSDPHAGRVAGIAAPPVAPVVQPSTYPGAYGGTAYPGGAYGAAAYGAPVVVSIPAVLMPDGRVYADFGYGYEPVLRSCAAPAAVTYGAVASSQQMPVNYSTPAYTLPTYDTPSYNQPAPAQPTAADQMLASAQRGQQPAQAGPVPLRTTAYPVISSCWATDAYGRVFVYRH